MDAYAKTNEKARIRERYKGTAIEKIEVIPAIGEVDFFTDESSKRVAVYARVSTDDVKQTSSFELQRNHYEDVIEHHRGWQLVEIYADEGITGTSLRNRDAFMRMIHDCEAGKIDLIVAKSIARFARNTVDCLGYVRKLAALKNPIGIFFETENIFTLNSNSELMLTINASLAQEESHIKSNSMNLSYEMRFRRGIFMTPVLLGYDQDEDGQLVINEDEALTVRLIFFMYLFGYELLQIAETLIKLGRLTKRGNHKWSANTVVGILQNERHCGDVLARKTWTPNYLDHKSKKNIGNRNQYRRNDHHEPIITRNDFIVVQHMLANARYGYRGTLPSLHVIDVGALSGYVIVNINWAAFSKEDYLEASLSGMPENVHVQGNVHYSIPAHGEFDLREYELVRKQFLSSQRDASLTFSKEGIQFSASCISTLEKTSYIEMLLNPLQQSLVVRPSSKDKKNAMQWANARGDQYVPRVIRCGVFLPILYDIMNWNANYKYRVKSIKKRNDSGEILLFDLRDTEVFIPNDIAQITGKLATAPGVEIELLSARSKRSFVAYPPTWAESFGSNFYAEYQPPELIRMTSDAVNDTQQAGKPFTREGEEKIEATSSEVLYDQINTLMGTMKQEAQTDDERLPK